MKWAPLLLLLVAVPATFAATLHPVPQISGLAPVSVAPGASAFTQTVRGANFVRGAMVQWNGSSRVTTLVSDTQPTARILATHIANDHQPVRRRNLISNHSRTTLRGGPACWFSIPCG